MFPFSLTSLFKYLIGILLVQAVTVLLVVTASRTDLEKTWLLFLLLALAVGVLTALWFTSMAEGVRKQALSRAKENFAREREKIRVLAEKEKAKEVKNSERLLLREKERAQTSGNLKTGLALGGAAGLGVVLVLTQAVTLGLLTLTTAGGAAVWYGLRARQDRLRLGTATGGAGQLPRVEKPVNVIEAPKTNDKKKKTKGSQSQGASSIHE